MSRDAARLEVACADRSLLIVDAEVPTDLVIHEVLSAPTHPVMPMFEAYMSVILAVSPHPDDETLGAGGTLLRHVELGHAVHWVVVTSGWSPKYHDNDILRDREQMEAVQAHYGFASHCCLELPSTRLAELAHTELVEALSPVFDRVRPDEVFTIHPGDVHTDHRPVFDACWTLCKPFRAASRGPRRFYSWETLSSTDAAPAERGREFVPTVWCDIAAQLDRKVAAMQLYKTEMQTDPLPRSESAIRALARVRGAQVGLAAAEAFVCWREVW